MAKLIKPDGIEQLVEPRNGKEFQLDELYALIECDTVQLVHLADGSAMFCDEEAKLKKVWPAVNEKATRLLAAAGGLPGDVVLGNVLVCTLDDAKAEEPDEDYSTDPLYGKRMDSADMGEN